MTQIIAKPKRRLSASLAAGLAISGMLALGSFAVPADAAWRGGGDNYYYGGGYGWGGGGYYPAPPVVYGSPYGPSYYGTPYYAPPVVYGPGIGIGVPGVTIGIR